MERSNNTSIQAKTGVITKMSIGWTRSESWSFIGQDIVRTALSIEVASSNNPLQEMSFTVGYSKYTDMQVIIIIKLDVLKLAAYIQTI